MQNNRINRREFIGKAAAGVVAAGIGISCRSQSESSAEKASGKINRTLGRTGLELPVVSFGVMNSASPDLLSHALESGIKHMDTAHLYLQGNSERAIGKFLEETGARSQVYLGTKMRFNRDREKHVFLLEGVERQPAATAENFEEQLNESLRRLRTDYVDILYIHSCYSPEMVLFDPLMEASLAAKKAGKARFIGISTHNRESDNIHAAVDAGIYDVVLTAYNYLMEGREAIKEAIQYAAANNVGIIAMKTQGGVRLNQEQKVEVNHKAALKWVLNDPNVCTTIPGITSIDQMDLDVSVMQDLTLTEQEERDLEIKVSRSDYPY
jgi:aryl-alcohol dehydrogenase-like predicted oxidoreductase